MLLAYFLREELRAHRHARRLRHSSCGCCVVVLDGDRAVKSCTMFAVQADGHAITTVEGLEQGGKLHPLQQAFWDQHGLQCGYCTPGMLMTASCCSSTIRSQAKRRSARAFPATCAAAPATRISSRPCSKLQRQNGMVAVMTTRPKSIRRPPLDGSVDEAQGRPALHSGQGPLPRRRRACRTCSILRWCTVRIRTRASPRSTRPPRWPCPASKP